MSSTKKRKSRRWERQVNIPVPRSEELTLPNVHLLPRVEPQLVSLNDAAARFRFEEMYTRETERERFRVMRLLEVMRDYVDRCSFLLVIFDLFTSKKSDHEKAQWKAILSRCLLTVPADVDVDVFDIQQSTDCICVPPRSTVNYLWNVIGSYLVEQSLLEEPDGFNLKNNFHELTLAHAALLGACEVFEYDLLRRGNQPLMSQIEEVKTRYNL